MSKAIGIFNGNWKGGYRNDELVTGIRLSRLEYLQVRLDVAHGMIAQTDWPHIVAKGEAIEAEVLHEILEIVDTDPAHRAVAVPDWQARTEAEAADARDLLDTQEAARF